MRLLWEINKDKKINLIQHEFYFFITFDHKIDFKSDKETVLPHFGQLLPQVGWAIIGVFPEISYYYDTQRFLTH